MLCYSSPLRSDWSAARCLLLTVVSEREGERDREGGRETTEHFKKLGQDLELYYEAASQGEFAELRRHSGLAKHPASEGAPIAPSTAPNPTPPQPPPSTALVQGCAARDHWGMSERRPPRPRAPDRAHVPAAAAPL
ncbi:hypothetical protein P4O66_014612 [Electrophorus voltai]|uniref:Uncharacterized protein n=1 Tax=Electrophorus voltai TaxID=2609070 RepID=A0AAD8Z3A7_9TELE|nr:hypothetical protein P4O66_014612 [Electrophorus voltai]